MSASFLRSLALAAVVTTGLAAPAHAIPEDGYAERFADEVLPFCLGQWQYGSLTGVAGIELAYATYRVAEPRGALVIVPGRREPLLRYCEVVYDLRDLGYDVYLIDHRGQGWSDRLIADRHRVHVESFDHYVADLHAFVTAVVQPSRYARVVALAHSMGGGIVTRYAELHPEVFTQLVLSAPMHALQTAPFPAPVAYALAVKATALGLGAEYAPTQGPPMPDLPLGDRDGTRSPARWAMRHTIERIFPELTVGGSTFRWLKECVEGTAALRADAAALRAPILLLQADDDAYVEAWGQDQVCRAAARCETVFYPTARHDLLMERDAIRDPVMRAIRAVL